MNRRDFLKRTGYAGAIFSGLFGRRVFGAPDPNWRKQSPNDKLNIGIIGTANRASANIDGVKGENIVAVCDVDQNYLDAMLKKFPKAESYRDFRKLLDRKDLDAVVVSTADHCHAPASAKALRLGMHVYCEKPLTHSVYEARTVAKLALENQRVTQMGTQIHAERNYRRVVELVQSGAIGKVTEVHVWCGKGWADGRFIKEEKPVPANMDWDLWLGPAPQRSFQPGIHPANWRKFWEYGGGTLGDMGCHYMDLPFWALKLRHPDAVEAEGPPVHAEGTPQDLTVHWSYPAREEMPACTVSWYDGKSRPKVLSELKAKDPKEIKYDNGVLFIGDKGMMLADYGRHKLLPEENFADFKAPPPTIPDSIGHYNEWIKAIKTGGTTTCNFDYSGALSEAILLGNVAYRVGQKFTWDAKELKAVNCAKAEELIRREYRKGWEL